MQTILKFRTALLLVSMAIVLTCMVAAARGQTPADYVEAKLVSLPKPDMPKEAADAGIGGKVSVRVTVGKDGRVTDVDEVFGPGWVCPGVNTPAINALRRTAKDAAARAVFTPAARGGKPAETRLYVSFDFGSSAPMSTLPPGTGVRAGNGPPAAAGQDVKAVAPAGPPKVVSAGVLNGKAKFLKPADYPPSASDARASGAVAIKVMVETDGTIYSAEPVSGHTMLLKSARLAACGSKFQPTLLEGQPVRLSGVITYNFVP